MTRTVQDLGYVRHPDSIDDVCFYCDNATTGETDYIPPRDVAKNPRLRAAVTVPFHSVPACHACKTHVYHRRYDLLTVEARRVFILSKLLKKGSKSEDEILNKLAASSIQPWEVVSYADDGTRVVSDLPEIMLDQHVLDAKRKFFNRAPAQKVEPSAQSLPVSGPQDAPGSAKTVDLGF